jgi:hypothetical protein
MCTASEFDHVAMVVRFDNPDKKHRQEICVIEATQQGVKLKHWTSLAQHIGNFYERVAVRHLQIERTEEHLKKLETFLRGVNNAQYEWRPSQLLNRKTVERDDLQDRKFFCSELVAKCFKVCGIMEQTQEASGNFLPADFSQQKDRLKLVNCRFSDQKQILLNKSIF